MNKQISDLIESRKHDTPTNINGMMLIPEMNLPGMRARWAIAGGFERNIVMKVHGGLGDQVCSEPTLRFALETLKDVDITLFAMNPELFSHLKFKDVYNIAKGEFPGSRYAVFDLFVTTEHFIVNFLCHDNIHAVDFSCLVAFQSMLPAAYREIVLKPSVEDFQKIQPYVGGDRIVLHPGRSWPSKTFPESWWNDVIARLQSKGVTPVIIGKPHFNAGTIDGLNLDGCIDLRNQTSTMEMVALLQKIPVVLTNDSSPLHMAASGDAWIGYVTMARRPEYLTHVRKNINGWRMENLGKGGLWEKYDFYLNMAGIDKIDENDLMRWLPTAHEFADWGISKL